MSGLRAMNTCRMNGSHERAVSPSMPLLVGTVRQPSTARPSDCTTCSNFCSTWRRTVGLRGRKMMPLPYWPGRGQRDARLAAHLLVERVRHLQQHAGAVAGVDLAAAGAAVVQVLQHLDRLLEHAVRLATLDVDDEPHAAGVVLVARVVETLPGGRARAARAGPRGRRRSAAVGEEIGCCALIVGPACGSQASLRGKERPRLAAEPALLNLSTVVDTTLI